MNNGVSKSRPMLIGPLLLAATLALLWLAGSRTPGASAAPAPVSPANQELAALRTEIERLKTLVPDQAHAMQDVGYHFANLWFAGQKKNWPLAQFYLGETRSHLKWAVRIIPVRKTKAGDLDLKGILDALDKTEFNDIQKTIESQDLAAFTNAYRSTLTGCYACHTAAEKPYLRPQIPSIEPAQIINMDPAANWPQ
jgi:hypothetical protein